VYSYTSFHPVYSRWKEPLNLFESFRVSFEKEKTIHLRSGEYEVVVIG
jgi:hypothetical protein